MTTRVYPLGLPVTVTVEDDGTVTAYVDLTEASRRRDLVESQDGLEDPVPDDVIADDAQIIDAAFDAQTIAVVADYVNEADAVAALALLALAKRHPHVTMWAADPVPPTPQDTGDEHVKGHWWWSYF